MRTFVTWVVMLFLLFFASVAQCTDFGFTIKAKTKMEVKSPVLVNADSVVEHGLIDSLVVGEVVPGSFAEKEGLQVGDQIIEFAGIVVKGAPVAKIMEAKNALGVGQTLDLKIIRGQGEAMTIRIIGVPSTLSGADVAPSIESIQNK